MTVNVTSLNGAMAEVKYCYHDHKLLLFSVGVFLFVTTSYFLQAVGICDHKLLPLRCWYLWPQVTSFKPLVFVTTSYFLYCVGFAITSYSLYCYLWSRVTSFIVICDHKLLPLMCWVCDHKLLPILLLVITSYFLYCYLWPQITSFKVLVFVITSYFLFCYMWSWVTSFIVICDHKFLDLTF
jgi:hypothetical protein